MTNRLRARSRRVAALTLGLAVLVMLVTACGSNGGVTSVSLRTLTSDQEQFNGSIVQTRGRLRAFVDPDGTRYVVAENARADRVLIEPLWAARQFLHARVTVVGCFTAGPSSVRTLRASRIVREEGGRPHRVQIGSHRSCRPIGRAPAA